jgi:two-component system sensor histidine kinase YesM
MTMLFLLISIPLLILIPLVIYSISSRIILEEAYDAGLVSLSVISSKLDLLFDSVERQSVLVVTDSKVQQLVASRATLDRLELYAQEVSLREYLTRASRATGIIDAFAVIYLDGNEYWSSGTLPEEGRRSSLLLIQDPDRHQRMNASWTGIIESPYRVSGEKVDVIAYSRTFNTAVSGYPTGVAEAFVTVDSIAKQISDFGLGTSGSIFILDGQGNGINIPPDFSDDPLFLDGVDNIDWSLRQEMVLSIPYDRFGWTIYGIAPMKEIVQGSCTLLLVTTLIIFFEVFLTSILIIRTSSRIAHPLACLARSAKAVGDGDLSVKFITSNQDEIGVLADAFNQMVDKLSALIQTITRDEQKKREYELELMTSQLNPHFLYNSLDAICGLAELGNTDELIEMVKDLSGFYRTTLNGGGALITLAEELELTNHFVSILNVRYPGKFKLMVSVGDNLKDLVLPKMTIQSLVENSIYHGLKPKTEGGQIYVQVSDLGMSVDISVKDNGVGFPVSVLLKESKLFESRMKLAGFGLHAVEERIRLYFGELAVLRIHSSPNSGAEVQINLPKLRISNEL